MWVSTRFLLIGCVLNAKSARRYRSKAKQEYISRKPMPDPQTFSSHEQTQSLRRYTSLSTTEVDLIQLRTISATYCSSFCPKRACCSLSVFTEKDIGSQVVNGVISILASKLTGTGRPYL